VLAPSPNDGLCLGDSLIAEKGVRHGGVNAVPVALSTAGAEAHPHFHFRPRT